MGSDNELHDEALRWIEKNAGSGKYANVDKSRVAVAGQSCGGIERCVSYPVFASARLISFSYNVAKNPLIKVVRHLQLWHVFYHPARDELAEAGLLLLGRFQRHRLQKR